MLQKTRNFSGKATFVHEVEVERVVMDKKHVKIIREAMVKAVEHGTAKKTDIENIAVAGKRVLLKIRLCCHMLALWAFYQLIIQEYQ